MIERSLGQIAGIAILASLLLALSMLTQPASAKSETNQVSFFGEGTVTCPGGSTHTKVVSLSASESGETDPLVVQIGTFPPFVTEKFIVGTQVKITDNKFKLEGVEIIDAICGTGASAANPIPATITGKCGPEATIRIEVESGETIEATGEIICSVVASS